MTNRDVNAFRERFNRWKLGDKVYESGRPLPAYEGGKDSFNAQATYDSNNDVYNLRYALPETTITGHKRPKPFKWVSPKGAGNMTVMPGDPEMVFFAPIAIGAGIAASPALSGLVSNIVTPGSTFWTSPITKQLMVGTAAAEGVNKATKAVTGYNSVGEGVGASIEKATGWNPNSTLVGQLATEAFNPGWYLSPNGVLNTAGRVSNVVEKTINSEVNKLPWTYKIPENPNMAYRRMGPLERDWLMEGNELSTRSTNALTEVERDAAVAAEKAAKPNRRFVLFKAGAEHGGRKQFAKGQPWGGTTVTHGEEQVLAIPGKDLPWVSGRHFHGPQGNGFGVGDISFEEAPFGSHIDLLTNEGYSGVNPSLLDGSVIYSPYKILDRNFGYKKLYPKITTPQITAENAASITPEQWTAAQDAAIAVGDMAEAQRLRDLHSTLTPTMTPEKYYRGTKVKRASYPNRHIDEEVGEMNGIYLTKKPKYAKTYGDVEEFYLRSNNPLETEGSWTGIIDDATRAEIENAGYDAVVNNRFDTGFLNKLLRNSRDETITFNGKNLKSADAVTFDDNGVRIPLGKRDNFNMNDIRYAIFPFVGGGVGYGLYNTYVNRINNEY